MLIQTGQSKDLSEAVAARLSNSRFHLIIFPTEKCNFRCTYCYEDFKISRMNSDVIQGLKLLISRRLEAAKFFEISWFGGEPLLALPVIEEVSNHSLEQTAHRGASFKANITTNGYLLTKDTFVRLLDLRVVEYQISLDGTGESHDQTRVRKGGGATFEVIYNNLLAMKAVNSEFEVIVRVHFMKSNIDHIRSLALNLRDDFSSDGRFKIYFKAINRLGGGNDPNLDVFSYAEQKQIKMELDSLFGNHTNTFSLQKNGDYICYAAAANSLAIRANGRIAKCTVALRDEENDLGTLQPDGSIELLDERFRLWVSALLTGNSATMACPIHHVRKNAAQADRLPT